MPFLLALAVVVAAFTQAHDVSGSADAVTTAQSKPPAATIPRITAALEQSQLRYEKGKDGLWFVTFQGKNVSSISVAVVALDEMVVLSSTVQKSAAPSAEALRALLRASYEGNFSRIAIDKEGTLVVMTELPKDFSASAFRDALKGVASLADDAAGIISGGATRPPSVADVPPGKGAALPILRGAFELSYDPAKWKVKSSEAGVTEFKHVSGDASVKVISERIEIPRENFRSIVIENAKATAPDMAVVSETPRVVNGLNVVVLRYGGTASGIKFTFYNQMYSDASGTIQIAAWTGTNLFDEYQRDFLELFAGLRKVR